MFFMLQQTIPLYLACEKALTIRASVRVTSPMNKFEQLDPRARERRAAVLIMETWNHRRRMFIQPNLIELGVNQMSISFA